MKSFRTYFAERQALGELGNQDLADDHEKYGMDQGIEQHAPSEDNTFPTPQDELSIIRKAMRIVLSAGDKYRTKVHSFLHRLARDLPELQNLVSQLHGDHEDDRDEDPSKQQGDPKKPVVSTPAADSQPEPSSSDQ